MSAPVIVIDEFNTSAQTQTQGITSVAYAAVDQNSNVVSLSALYPVLPGTSSFEKWLAARVSSVAPTSLSNFTVSWSGTPVSDAGASVSTVVPYFGVNAVYPAAGPSSSPSAYATTPCVGGSAVVTAPPNTLNALSGFIISQTQVGTAAAQGACVFPSPFLFLSYVWS